MWRMMWGWFGCPCYAALLRHLTLEAVGKPPPTTPCLLCCLPSSKAAVGITRLFADLFLSVVALQFNHIYLDQLCPALLLAKMHL